jgi:hypothetical protein
MKQKYFDWMCNLVCDHKHQEYQTLLEHLHDIEFRYILDMDGNRAEDGEDLRYRYGFEFDIPRVDIEYCLDDRPCSILEMMVALAHRCEENIMDDPDFGDRTGKWFWGMIENLGLDSMDDDHFDEDYVDMIVERLLERKYDPDGAGGLFTLHECRQDLRTVDIWYQLMWYLSENFDFTI